MRRNAQYSMIALLLLFISAASAGQDTKLQEGKHFWAKWIEARGGRARLAKITEFKSTSELKIIQRGLNLTMTTYKKGPNKFRIDQQVMGMTITQVVNGDKGWSINPQTGFATDMPDATKAQLMAAANEYETLLNPEQFGIVITFEGRESIGGKEYILLQHKRKEDTVGVTFYIDPATLLRYKYKWTTGSNVEDEVIVSDYRDVEGIKVPFKQVHLQNGKEISITTFTDYKFNCNLDDSLFVKQ